MPKRKTNRVTIKTAAIAAILACCGGACAPVNPKVVGADRDAHGCIGSAGYVWCDQRQKCLRPWEEPCVAGETITACYDCEGLGKITVVYFVEDGASISAAGAFYKLERAISGSGARYQGRGIMIWDKAGRALLELKGQPHDCMVTPCGP